MAPRSKQPAKAASRRAPAQTAPTASSRQPARKKQTGAAAGVNPAPKTAFGVFQGMRAAVELKLGRT